MPPERSDSDDRESLSVTKSMDRVNDTWNLVHSVVCVRVKICLMHINPMSMDLFLWETIQN